MLSEIITHRLSMQDFKGLLAFSSLFRQQNIVHVSYSQLLSSCNSHPPSQPECECAVACSESCLGATVAAGGNGNPTYLRKIVGKFISPLRKGKGEPLGRVGERYSDSRGRRQLGRGDNAT